MRNNTNSNPQDELWPGRLGYYIRTGQKIQAIHAVRIAQGLRSAEAKYYVEDGWPKPHPAMWGYPELTNQEYITSITCFHESRRYTMQLKSRETGKMTRSLHYELKENEQHPEWMDRLLQEATFETVNRREGGYTNTIYIMPYTPIPVTQKGQMRLSKAQCRALRKLYDEIEKEQIQATLDGNYPIPVYFMRNIPKPTRKILASYGFIRDRGYMGEYLSAAGYSAVRQQIEDEKTTQQRADKKRQEQCRAMISDNALLPMTFLWRIANDLPDMLATNRLESLELPQGRRYRAHNKAGRIHVCIASRQNITLTVKYEASRFGSFYKVYIYAPQPGRQGYTPEEADWLASYLPDAARIAAYLNAGVC